MVCGRSRYLDGSEAKVKEVTLSTKAFDAGDHSISRGIYQGDRIIDLVSYVEGPGRDEEDSIHSRAAMCACLCCVAAHISTRCCFTI